MIRKITNVLFALIFIAGFGIFAYPVVSDQWNAYRQSQLISSYNEAVAQMEEADYSREWEAARAYNGTMLKNDFYGDAFGAGETEMEDSEYWKVLNTSENGVMGYMTIPKINVKLAIYHGVGDDVLQTGIGHLEGTRLPIGGEGSHSVLAAHRGLPSARLFTDLDQMEPGDKFYVHVLDEVFAYQVDQILPMIDKDDLEMLMSSMQVVEGEDYITLLTCTPYGVNSHRLLVRGSRVEYEGEEAPRAETPVGTMVEAVQSYYMLYLVIAMAAAMLLGSFVMAVRGIVKRFRAGKKQTDKKRTDNQETDSQKAENQRTESQETGDQKAENQRTESQETGDQKAESQEAENQGTESQETGNQKTDNQEAEESKQSGPTGKRTKGRQRK